MQVGVIGKQKKSNIYNFTNAAKMMTHIQSRRYATDSTRCISVYDVWKQQVITGRWILMSREWKLRIHWSMWQRPREHRKPKALAFQAVLSHNFTFPTQHILSRESWTNSQCHKTSCCTVSSAWVYHFNGQLQVINYLKRRIWSAILIQFAKYIVWIAAFEVGIIFGDAY